MAFKGIHMAATKTPVRNWDKNHDPEERPLGCNGRYGNSGGSWHRRQTRAKARKVCARCKKSAAHYARERRRGGIKPRELQPCGTWAAAVRHRYKGEELDFACRLAEAKQAQEKRDRKRKGDPK